MASNNGRKFERLLLIYIYEKLGHSNVKIINEIESGSRVLLDRDFSAFNYEENNKYLADWAKENNIKSTHYKVIGDKGFHYHTDKNGVPILVEENNIS